MFNENAETVIKQEPIERPLRRSPRLAELAEKKTNISQTMNFQTTSHGVYPAEVIARCIEHINACCIQTYTVKQGIRKWGNKGYSSAIKELEQLHSRTCFTPLKLKDISRMERKKAMEAVTFMVQKRDETVKTRMCANGSTQRVWMDKEDKSSPTVSLEALAITAALDAAEGRSIITLDIPNAFIQTIVVSDKDGDKIILILRDEIALMLVDLDPDVYLEALEYHKGKPVLYLHVQRAIYGMLQSALLFYEKFVKDLTEYGFKLNPYDPCVANKTVNGEQLTIVWHVDDVKASHEDQKVLDTFGKWVNDKYGDDKIGKVKITRGHRHDYLGMILDFATAGEVKIDMQYYVQAIVEDFEHEYGEFTKRGNAETPHTATLFTVNESPTLVDKRQNDFHAYVARALFLCKRARPDVQPTVSFLITRVKEPTKQD
mgnify:CR=1 FL=1